MQYLWGDDRFILKSPELPFTVMTRKQTQFNQAMEKYHSNPLYSGFGIFIATSSISLQLLLLMRLFSSPMTLWLHIIAFLLAYLLTDLLNGLIHMVMDHHDNYTACYGPLVAQFHLHHRTPRYTRRPLPLVYFHETGAKIWLTPYLLVVWWLFSAATIPSLLLTILVYVGVLSSVAEVSHYLCHSSDSKWVGGMAKLGVLLSRSHHTLHHTQDNTNYAFLNGMSDPLINRIARRYYNGYKQHTDTHFAAYSPTSEQDSR